VVVTFFVVFKAVFIGVPFCCPFIIFLSLWHQWFGFVFWNRGSGCLGCGCDRVSVIGEGWEDDMKDVTTSIARRVNPE